jgi:hypothetical protein
MCLPFIAMYMCACLPAKNTGTRIYRQKIIPTYSLERCPDTRELVCQNCHDVASEHEQRDVRRRPPTHAFAPACHMAHDKPVATFAWEPLPENSEISAFVRWCVRRDHAPSMWFQSIKDRDRIAHELEQTVGDSDLPVLDLTCKRWGLANSFRHVACRCR